jgi:cellulose synthase/poly-beta-1,6-N-acetylglucosamine synthase-like glycosyltransferase
VKLVLNDGVRGVSATRNVGIRASRGDIIANLDDDAVAESDWLERLVDRFRDPNVMAVSACALPVWPANNAPTWFAPEFQFMVGCTGHFKLAARPDGEIRNVTGTSMAFRREAYARAGLWREELGRGPTQTGGEEAELCLRVRGCIPGASIVYEPRAVVHHQVPAGRADLRYIARYAYNEGRVRAMIARYAAPVTRAPLSEEYRFFLLLLTRSLPERMLRFWSAGSLQQAAFIVGVISLIVGGYARERCQELLMSKRRAAFAS